MRTKLILGMAFLALSMSANADMDDAQREELRNMIGQPPKGNFSVALSGEIRYDAYTGNSTDMDAANAAGGGGSTGVIAPDSSSYRLALGGRENSRSVSSLQARDTFVNTSLLYESEQYMVQNILRFYAEGSIRNYFSAATKMGAWTNYAGVRTTTSDALGSAQDPNNKLDYAYARAVHDTGIYLQLGIDQFFDYYVKGFEITDFSASTYQRDNMFFLTNEEYAAGFVLGYQIEENTDVKFVVGGSTSGNLAHFNGLQMGSDFTGNVCVADDINGGLNCSASTDKLGNENTSLYGVTVHSDGLVPNLDASFELGYFSTDMRAFDETVNSDGQLDIMNTAFGLAYRVDMASIGLVPHVNFAYQNIDIGNIYATGSTQSTMKGDVMTYSLGLSVDLTLEQSGYLTMRYVGKNSDFDVDDTSNNLVEKTSFSGIDLVYSKMLGDVIFHVAYSYLDITGDERKGFNPAIVDASYKESNFGGRVQYLF